MSRKRDNVLEAEREASKRIDEVNLER